MGFIMFVLFIVIVIMISNAQNGSGNAAKAKKQKEFDKLKAEVAARKAEEERRRKEQMDDGRRDEERRQRREAAERRRKETQERLARIRASYMDEIGDSTSAVPKDPEPVKTEPAPKAPEPVKTEPIPKVPEPVKTEPAPKAPEPVKTEPIPKAPEPVKTEPAPKAPETVKTEPIPKVPEPVKTEPIPKAPEPVKTEPAPKAPEPVRNEIPEVKPAPAAETVPSKEEVRTERVITARRYLMDINKYPSQAAVNKAMKEDQRLIALVAFNGMSSYISRMTDTADYNEFLGKIGRLPSEADSFFRITFTRSRAVWDYDCPPGYRVIPYDDRRKETYYNDGMTVIKDFLGAVGYSPEITVPEDVRKALGLPDHK